jgi:hypothetical protein
MPKPSDKSVKKAEPVVVAPAQKKNNQSTKPSEVTGPETRSAAKVSGTKPGASNESNKNGKK